MKATWTTRKCSIEQRATVCSGVDEEAEQNAGNRNKIVNSVLPTDRWADITDKPRTGTVSLVLC